MHPLDADHDGVQSQHASPLFRVDLLIALGHDADALNLLLLYTCEEGGMFTSMREDIRARKGQSRSPRVVVKLHRPITVESPPTY